MLGGKSGRISTGQKSVLCIGRRQMRADGMETWCMMLVGSVGRSGEMAVQGREKTGVKCCEARRSSATSSRRATGTGIGERVYDWV